MNVQLEGKKVVVIGLGASGVAAARLCRQRGARVVGTDSKPLEELSPPSERMTSRSLLEAIAGLISTRRMLSS